MTLKELFDKVEEHEDLEGEGIMTDTANGPMLLIRYKPTQVITQIPAAVVEEVNWETLEPVLLTKREPQMLYHMTRVCGYYSRTSNWNESKLGELKDRHKGKYALREDAA